MKYEGLGFELMYGSVMTKTIVKLDIPEYKPDFWSISRETKGILVSAILVTGSLLSFLVAFYFSHLIFKSIL